MARGAQRKTGRFKALFSVAALLTVAGFLAYKIYAVSLERYQINKQISTAAGKLQELDAQSKDLKALVARLQDRTYLEKEARKKLNVQLPGEQAVIITGGSGAKQNIPQKDSSTKLTALSNAKQWLETLFGK